MHHTSTVWSAGLEVCPVPASVSSSTSTMACCDCCAHAGTDPLLSSERHQSAATWGRRLSTLLLVTQEEKLHWTPPILRLFQSSQHSETSAQARTEAGAIPRHLAALTRQKEILVQALCWWDKPASSASPSLRLKQALNTSKDKWQLKKKRMWGSQIYKLAPKSQS